MYSMLRHHLVFLRIMELLNEELKMIDVKKTSSPISNATLYEFTMNLNQIYQEKKINFYFNTEINPF